MTSETRGRFKRWFWRPPRAHGESIADRQVSFLELLYDLVYVAVIGQAAHHLGEHVSIRTLAEFAVVFALIWIAWNNGSLYLELHGREDGRTRSIIFVQMGILALLAVFTADAADGSGWSFAVVYATYQVVRQRSGTPSGARTVEATQSSGRRRGPTWSAWGCRWRCSWPAPSSRPPHGSSCGPALPSPGSLASCWRP
jgi:Bacterial low temperature requirement A protein (LtrA)